MGFNAVTQPREEAVPPWSHFYRTPPFLLQREASEQRQRLSSLLSTSKWTWVSTSWAYTNDGKWSFLPPTPSRKCESPKAQHPFLPTERLKSHGKNFSSAKKASLMHLSQENTRIWFIGSFTFQPSLDQQAQNKYYTWKSLVQFTQAEFCFRCMNSVLIGQETWAETTDFLLTGDSLTWKVKFPGSYEWTDFMNGLISSTKFNDMDAA